MKMCFVKMARWHEMTLSVMNRKLNFEYKGFIVSLMQEFLKAPLLVLHFSDYILMTFLVMLSVILLSILMKLHPILRVIRHLICGNNLNGHLDLNLICETLWTGVRRCWENSTGFV